MSLLKELPKREFVAENNKNYLTAQEIKTETGMSLDWCHKYIRSMVKSGKWKEKYKRINNYPIRAYGHE